MARTGPPPVMRARIALAAWLACCAASSLAVPGADPEAARLLERAEFWQGRSRDDLAREELEKLLRLAPDHAEGLVLLARLQLRANQDRDAAATLERLRKAHPAHFGVAQLATLLRIRGADKEKLRQARQLARAGRSDEAVIAFRAIFPDGFPDDELALEFAQVLAATRNGRDAGGGIIAELARKHADDPKYQVAWAADLSMRKPVAASTLRLLRELTAVPPVARQALEAWRRALLAIDPVAESIGVLRKYLAANPGDSAVREKLEQVTQAVAAARKLREDPGYRARREGAAALEAGRLAEAEPLLESAIARHVDDGEAIGTMGLLRLREGRHAEALDLFQRARRLDAANRARWASLEGTARYWGLLQQAREAREAGVFDEARARVREARAVDPNESAAKAELARIQVAAGHEREAELLLSELAPEQRRPVEEAIKAARATRLRDRARELQAQRRDPEAIAALEEAAALKPLDPWLAHDLARLYAATGEPRRGEALATQLLARRGDDADTRYAMALFLSSIDREADALALLEGIAPTQRSDGMGRLERHLWVSVQARRAADLAKRGEGFEAERVVASMREAIGGDVTLALEVARSFERLGKDAEVRSILERVAALGGASPEQEQAIADLKLSRTLRGAEALRNAGRVGEALQFIEGAESARRSPEQQLRYDYERARLLRAMDRSSEAADIYRAILRASPGEREAQLALIETLLEVGELAGARALAGIALESRPDDARVLAQVSRIAQREGDIDGAVAYEQRSLALEPSDERWRQRRLAELRDQQLGWLGAGLDTLYRSGTAGKSRIETQELSLGYREPWSRAGRAFFRVAPVRVTSGTLDMANETEAGTFGSLILCQPLCAGPRPPATQAGVAFAAGTQLDDVRIDIGTTPIGFPVVNLVGGALYKADLGAFSYSIEASRRPLASSLLSYAGTRDPNTGRIWGGVVATGARVNVSRDGGGDYGAWSLVGLSHLTGKNVKDNVKAELMVGAYRRVINEEDRQLAAGFTALLWRFSENAGEYTFGHGGYYSPRTFASAALPITFGLRWERTSLHLRASVSMSWSESQRAAYFPTDAELQAGAQALASVSGTDPFYSGGGNGRGYGRSFAAAAEHQLAPNLFVGVRLELERSANYTPNRLLLYLRMSPDGAPARPIALPPEPVVLPGFQY